MMANIRPNYPKLSDPDPVVRLAGLPELPSEGTLRIPILMEKLADPVFEVRREAVNLLARSEPKYQQAMPVLFKLFPNESRTEVRRSMLLALGKMDSKWMVDPLAQPVLQVMVDWLLVQNTTRFNSRSTGR